MKLTNDSKKWLNDQGVELKGFNLKILGPKNVDPSRPSAGMEFKVVNAETGEPVNNVLSVDVNIQSDSVPTATFTIEGFQLGDYENE